MDDAALRAILSPTRRRILRLVWTSEMASGDIASRVDVSWAAVSQNLKVLRETGLVTERRVGKHRYYRARIAPRRPIAALLQSMWRSDLDRLRELAESEERRR